MWVRQEKQLDLLLLTDEAVERADAALVVKHDLLDGALPPLVSLGGQLPLLVRGDQHVYINIDIHHLVTNLVIA